MQGSILCSVGKDEALEFDFLVIISTSRYMLEILLELLSCLLLNRLNGPLEARLIPDPLPISFKLWVLIVPMSGSSCNHWEAHENVHGRESAATKILALGSLKKRV